MRQISLGEVLEKLAFIGKFYELDPAALLGAITVYLDSQIKLLNFKNQMEIPLVTEGASLVIDKYQYDTLEDIVLAFEAFKTGRLSIKVANYFKFSPLNIIEIMDTYMIEIKIPEREKFNQRKHFQSIAFGEDVVEKPSPERVREIIAQSRLARAELKKPSSKNHLTDYAELVDYLVGQYKDYTDEQLQKLLDDYKFYADKQKIITEVIQKVKDGRPY